MSHYVLEVGLVLGLLPAPEASVPGSISSGREAEALRVGSDEPSVGREGTQVCSGPTLWSTLHGVRETT